MKTCAALLVLVAAVLALGFTTAVAQDAPIDGAKWYAEGNAFLKKGDLENALTAFGQAAGAPDAKPEYKRKFLQTRAVIKMREVIATEQDEAKWFKTATRLRNFYYSFRLHADLHALAAEMHKRRPTIGTASLLADACLMLGQNEEAEETLASCEAEKLNLQAKVLLAAAGQDGSGQGGPRRAEDPGHGESAVSLRRGSPRGALRPGRRGHEDAHNRAAEDQRQGARELQGLREAGPRLR